MLIALADDVALPVLDNDANSIAALENVLVACFNGFHCLQASQNLVRQLLSSNLLSVRAAAVLKDVANNAPQRDALWRSFSTKAIVTTSVAGVEKPNATQWRVPLSHFSHATLTETVLLAEDLDDAQFYSIVASMYSAANKLSSIKIALVPRSGGGNNTPNEFEAILVRGREFCFCITDSDRISPVCEVNVVCKACEALVVKFPWVGRHLCLPVRELENLIPQNLLTEALDKGMQARIAQYFACGKIVPELMDHGDVKDGVRGKWVFALAAGSPKTEFWIGALRKLKTAGHMASDCIDELKCDKPEECKCVALPSLGTKVMEGVTSWLKKQSTHKALEAISGARKGQLLQIGEGVFQMCCATGKLRC